MRAPEAVVSRFYVRLMVSDKAGALGQFTTILGRHGVSIQAASQLEPISPEAVSSGFVPVVMLIHPTPDAALSEALEEVLQSGVIGEKPVKLRVL